jgi:IS1 family transposase
VYSCTAVKPSTRLFLAHVEGKRTTADYKALLCAVENMRSLQSDLPLFTSDNWDAIKDAVTAMYSYSFLPSYQGRGRPPNSINIPFQNLKYAQVCKQREKGRVIDVIQRVVFGSMGDILSLLEADGQGVINTAYVERMNLTIRNCLARFIRRTMNESKTLKMHSRTLDFFQAWYNFVKPHDSLRIPIIGDGNRKWKKRTPAMAEGLTDHIWSLEELLSFKVPFQ